MLVKDAKTIVGGLSNPSKMPGYGYAISALECRAGTLLRAIKGSTCGSCYAMRGRYVFPNVRAAHARRLASLADPRWVDAMAFLIGRYGPHFRWHDSGDIQSIDHLRQIVRVAELTPGVTHWLPTREYAIVKKYRAAYGEFPANLTVRLSAHMVDGPMPSGYGLPTSTVEKTHVTYSDSHTCPARTQGNACGDCRACWDSSVSNVSYPIH